jgi:mono/diheme cytochrome c family protein
MSANSGRVSIVRVLAIGIAALMLISLSIALYLRQRASVEPSAGKSGDAARGQYLARAGNCLSCHTARGGKPYAGGRAIQTPFGTLYSPNITPDAETGIGQWSPEDFRRALHEGKSKDGSLLYPAFPYTNYTKVTREDLDAMAAFFRTVPPVRQPNKPHEMRFPYDKRVLLAPWRTLYFKEGEYRDDPAQTPEWNRGAYLVQGLGHCNACHAERNTLGAVREDQTAGGLIRMLNWYAPSLTSSRETGLGDWEVAQIVMLLKTGIADRGAVFGPMAEVVHDSLQHLTEADLAAMAVYLKSQREEDKPPEAGERLLTGEQRKQSMLRGAHVYKDRCAPCHQPGGEGVPRVYPPLANNEAIVMRNPVNAIRMVLNGGFPPSTAGNPRPYGMPPFAQLLSDEEIASVVTYVRGSWGNAAAPVSNVEVAGARGVPVD